MADGSAPHAMFSQAWMSMRSRDWEGSDIYVLYTCIMPVGSVLETGRYCLHCRYQLLVTVLADPYIYAIYYHMCVT